LGVANPRLWVFAGPNGSGKSTFYRNAAFLQGADPFFVALRTPELHLARRLRSFANLTHVFPKAYFAQVWDNSGTEPELLFEKHGGTTEMFDAQAIPEVTAAVKAASP